MGAMLREVGLTILAWSPIWGTLLLVGVVGWIREKARLRSWRRDPEFQAMVERHRQALAKKEGGHA